MRSQQQLPHVSCANSIDSCDAMLRQEDASLPSSLDVAITELEEECTQLRAHNRHLRTALGAVLTKVKSAVVAV